MRKLYFAILISATIAAAQKPLINLALNAASNIPPENPNGAIAQGAIFTIWGDSLGPRQLTFAPLPLPTFEGLGGTSISVTVNGSTVAAPVCYTWLGQVGGVMPSNTPIGNGTPTVTYNGMSGSIPVTVVPSNLGIVNYFPDSETDGGQRAIAAVTRSDYEFVTPTNTAKPGDTLILWGTGLGATPNSGGDTVAGPAANIGIAPLVFVGGIPSPSVTYWGRSPNSTPGLDQINFVVPPDAPLGCNVSVVVQVSPTLVSNAPTMSLAAADGVTCSDPADQLPSQLVGNAGLKSMYVSKPRAI